MAYERLLQQRLISNYQARPQEVRHLLQVASRDLSTAAEILPNHADWAFNIVYNAVLQAARALVMHEGYRPRGVGQHRTIVLFCQEALGPQYRRQIALFDQMRRKRHRLVYEMVGLVSHQEAEQALIFAKGLVEELTLRISGPVSDGV